jgi:hypothetical protein
MKRKFYTEKFLGLYFPSIQFIYKKESSATEERRKLPTSETKRVEAVREEECSLLG